jgi:primosomal protein N' (replication factor Y)
VLLRAEAPKGEAPRQFLQEVAAIGATLAGMEVEFWGPVPAPMERRAGRIRAHLLIQSPLRSGIQRLLAVLLPRIQALQSARRVRWSLDVDPQEMF